MQTHQPTTLSFSQAQEAILTSLSQGANRTSACHAAGLPRRTFYNWIRDDVAFAEAVEEAEAESIGVAEDLAYACAMKAIEDPRYLRALFFWLKHRAGWIQARPDRPPSTSAVGARHAVPSPDPDAPPVNTEDLASVMNLVKEFQRREREDEEFMRGYEEWKQLSEEERESILQEDESHLVLGDEDLPRSGGGKPEENPVLRVPSVPSENKPGEHEVDGKGTPMACPAPAPASSKNPGIRVPFVPSENTQPETRNTKPPTPKRDRMHGQRFKKKKRR